MLSFSRRGCAARPFGRGWSRRRPRIPSASQSRDRRQNGRSDRGEENEWRMHVWTRKLVKKVKAPTSFCIHCSAICWSLSPRLPGASSMSRLRNPRTPNRYWMDTRITSMSIQSCGPKVLGDPSRTAKEPGCNQTITGQEDSGVHVSFYGQKNEIYNLQAKISDSRHVSLSY